MKQHAHSPGRAAVAVLAAVLLAALLPTVQACAQQPEWQQYLQQAPFTLQQFLHAPLKALRSLLPQSPLQAVRQQAAAYAGMFLFLLLAMLVAFLAGNAGPGSPLDLLAAGGCSLLLWQRMLQMAALTCEAIEGCKTFLLGFIPVCAGVLAMGGEGAAAGACAFLLTALCALAQLASVGIPFLLQCYLALTAACCISTEQGLAAACRGAGRLLRQGIAWAGRAFAALLGVQRVFAAASDKAALRTGQLLSASVPIIGQTLQGAAETVLAGMQLLKSGLGFAAAAVLAAEFVPLYLALLLHSALLSAGMLLCAIAGLQRCEALLGCLREAVYVEAAAVALFFAISVIGTALMLFVGGG